ncbi:YHS domain-containing (seleno)protein [Chthonobacter albigriseus]|uniref:YHS domain-containing (seleno)protein n=1 Tax=Chthonobacter albigriseus TaxID=1683161 RepID=UPI0015EF64D4|nr:YHS domain-containing (seleno)protein [Chthonobacter albigriseus]
MPATRAVGAISDRYVHDAYTGLALGGYDPVAYFVDGKAVRGVREFEAVYDGAYWRFSNAGNAAAFIDAPKVYVPAYGGYNTVAVAGGRLEASDPTLFAVHANRVHLFATAADRETFLKDPAGYTALAEARWPGLLDTLSR